MMCVVASVCLSCKYFCMSMGGRDGSAGAPNLRSYLSSCETVLLVMILWSYWVGMKPSVGGEESILSLRWKKKPPIGGKKNIPS